MTWTKLGDEFSDEARDLTDAEYRTHSDALIWSNRRGLDLLVPKRDLRKFGESPHADEAPEGLIAKGWWADEGECWNIGLRFPEWQLERAVIEKRREATALRMRRMRLHKAADHSLCLPASCPSAGVDVTRNEMRHEMRNPGRVGTGLSAPTDPLLDQSQNPSQNPGGTFPPDPPGQPPSSADRISGSKFRAGAGGDGNPGHAEAASVKTGSVVKSQNQGLTDGSETAADDAQESPPNRAERPGANRYAGTRERFGRTVSAGTAFDERFAELRREHERQAREPAEHPEAS
jgi:hypothetical protein